MKPWLISVAMEPEAELLTARWPRTGDLAGRPCFEGRLAGRNVLLQLSGMGMVNAAAAVGGALQALPELGAVINLGCAGAFETAGLSMGQAVLAHGVVLADLGVQTKNRLHGLDKINIPLWRDPHGREYFNHLPVDQALSDQLDQAAGPLARGLFATVGRVSGDPATAQVVAERWGAAVEEMESGAVALVALQQGVPLACVRGVSNVVGRRELDVAAGAEAAQRVLLALGDAG